MTPIEFRRNRYRLGLTLETAAVWFDVTPLAVARWERGVPKRGIPSMARILMNLFIAQHNGDNHALGKYIVHMRLEEQRRKPYSMKNRAERACELSSRRSSRCAA